MASIKLTIPVHASWGSTDQLLVYKGTENAANLAASTPTGGSQAASREVGSAAPGSDIEITIGHSPTDRCAVLPVGVIVKDAAGNTQAVLDTTIALMDPPRGPGRPDVAATASAGEATLTWTASPDL